MNPESINPDESAQDQWIDSLLRSELATELESPPSALVLSINTVAGRRRRQRRLIACGLAAAAAAVMVGVGWTLSVSRHAERVVVRQPHEVAANVAAPSPSLSIKGRGIVEDVADVQPPRATFAAGPELIVVPFESRHSNVTIVRVYQTYQPPYAAKNADEEGANANEVDFPNPFNGG